jgi:hypothetical protein
MKFIDEFRDVELAKKVIAKINSFPQDLHD